MPTKIRLQRKGKKGQPFYHIVIADGRAPRDGKFIEKIGVYNPLTKPAEIVINFEKALSWLKNGAQPTDTVRSLLAHKGIIYKNHLLKGVDKGAMTLEQAEMKFQDWLAEKEQKISRKKSEHELNLKEARKKAIEHESKIKEARAQELSAKFVREQKAAEKAAAAEMIEPEPEITRSVQEQPEEIVEPKIIAEVESPASEITATKELPASESTGEESKPE